MLTRRFVTSSLMAMPAFASATFSGGRHALAATMRDRVLGDPEAPVEMIEYSSLTCPHCASFHAGAYGDIKERYIDTGKVRLVYRDFPTDGLALLAAQLPHCLDDAPYFALLNQLFAQQAQWTSAASDADSIAMAERLGLTERLTAQGFGVADVEGVSGRLRAIIRLAALAGLSEQDAADCLADADLRNAIWERAQTGGSEFGVRSTPSFIIDGELQAGNRSIDEFAEIIDPLL